MAGRRLHLARLMMAMGVHSLISRNLPASMLVLNYHRIRAPGQTTSEFDDGVFDADFDTFCRQMRWLRSATQVLDEDGLLKLGSHGELPRGTLFTAVTFDDGYIDCITLVKPVLDELGIRGIFFIPVEILESRKLGWWDAAAYLMKKSRRSCIKVAGRTLPLGPSLAHSLRQILNLFKLEPAERTEGLLAELADACDVAPPCKDRQSAELMDWTQVSQLRASGHSIGSHAWSHRPLATLSPESQAREIAESRRELQAIVGANVLSFAYPVGGLRHFNDVSVALVRAAGYEQAFTFNTGISRLPVADRFRIPRESAKSLALLKAKALLPGFMCMKGSATASATR
jgi:peptidoglycan/xylan/chitin deacetylase (PgdA/CDA1 family)